jgi:alcohol dehydrogenase
MAQYDLFEFRNRSRILYGIGCRRELPHELEQLGANKILICTDRGVREAGVVDMVSDVLAGASIELAGVYDGILQDARVGPINEAAAEVLKTKANGIIALGGGSVMDSVKAVVHMIGHDQTDFQVLLNNPIFDFKPLMPHIAFPTTSGTGCEVTNGGVIYDEQEKRKGGFMDTYCSSDVALLDPELVVGLPPKITAFTGMDALTHAIEAYTTTVAQPFSDAMCLPAIKTIMEWLPEAVRNGKDLEARGEMMIAACMAGIAILNAVAGAVHATAHALGGRFGIPHGLANAIMLPWVMEANLEVCAEKYKNITKVIGGPTEGLTTVEAGRWAVDAVRRLKGEINLTERLSDFGISETMIDEVELVDLALSDLLMNLNPKGLEFDEVRSLYLKAL